VTHPMSKIVDAEDLISEARGYIDCVFMAAASLTYENRHAISITADMASKKINEAIALLDQYRGEGDASPVTGSANEWEE
jgi:hypothetical protein